MKSRDTLETRFFPEKESPPVRWRISEGLTPYADAVALMEAEAEHIAAGEADELVWLVEHPPLYTAGTSAKAEDLVAPDRFEVHATGRGGEYTYHGPGQRVAYVMLDLKRRRQDVRAFVSAMEAVIIGTLESMNVTGERREDRVGVWVRRPDKPRLADSSMAEDKIAAIGIRLRKWVSFHGLAINVDPDLEHFSGIVPCGVRAHGVTSLVDLGLPIPMHEADIRLRDAFETVFGPTRDDRAGLTTRTMWVERGVRQSRMARRINGKGDYPVAKKATLARAVLKAFGDEDCLSWHDLGLRLEDDRALKFAFSVTRFSPIPFLVRTVDGDGIVHCCRTREMHSPNEPAPRSGFYQHRRRRYQDAHTDQTGQVRLIFGSSPAYRPLVRETLLPFGMPKTNQLCGIFVIRGALQDHAHSIYGTAFEPDPSNFTPPQMLIAPGMPIKPWNRIKKRYANTNERIRNPIDPDEISGIDEWDHDYEMPDKR